MEAQARAAQPMEFRLPGSANEMPVRTSEEWQSSASIDDEIFVNDIDNCIKSIVADEALVQRLRQSSLTWETRNGGFSFMCGISAKTLVPYALMSHPLYGAL